MFRFFKQYQMQMMLFLFILLPLISIDPALRPSEEVRFYNRWVYYAVNPIQSAISWVLHRGVKGFEYYVYLVHTKEENVFLLRQNQHLLREIATLQEAQQENIRLKKLLLYQQEHKVASVVARVIARDFSSDFRSITINRGSDAGLKRNMAVVSDHGVIGRIFRLTETTADVITLLDILSAIDVVVARSRAHGVLTGSLEDLSELKYVLRTDDIQIGDVLLTSGLGGVFPKGLQVGRVFQVTKKPYGVSQEVKVKPSVDFSKIEEVLVILKSGQE